ncbi:MAG: glycerophosphodiester phosphodiesterase family protein, partial [Verrucomicrobia bacterium]|nr:glycerophosphodiester phosphodiesterase family protein [Verrucomicrobiota bacterium]
MKILILGSALLSVLTLFMPAEALTAPKAPLHRIHADNPKELRELFAYSDERMPLVSAHRGGAVPGYPENCIATFEHTLESAYSMLEIDLRYTKDGHLVLHHDPTLNRTTSGSGPVENLTLVELKKLKLIDREGTVTDYRIPTLDETIEWARGKTILILDKKEVLVETCVRKIREHKAQAHVMIMVGNMEDIKAIYDLDPDIMMEVFVGTRERYEEFNKTGVPWNRIIPFISHQPPEDQGLIDLIHAKGSSCMVGSSRYLDRE